MEGSEVPADQIHVKELVVEVGEESAIGDIFKEVQQLVGTGPNSQLIQVSGSLSDTLSRQCQSFRFSLFR